MNMLNFIMDTAAFYHSFDYQIDYFVLPKDDWDLLLNSCQCDVDPTEISMKVNTIGGQVQVFKSLLPKGIADGIYISLKAKSSAKVPYFTKGSLNDLT